MTAAYLEATGRELRTVQTVESTAGGTTEIPDHRSKEVANENARNIGALFAQVAGVAGTGKIRG